MDESIKEFLLKNEKLINQKLSKILFYTIPTFPLLILLQLVGIFPKVENVFMVSCCIFFTMFCIYNFFYIKKYAEKTSNKYIMLLVAELVILWISVNHGLSMFITYVLVILASVLYFDWIFTLQVSICCYSCYAASILIRGLSKDISYFYRTDDILLGRINWILSVEIGGGVEIVIYSIFAIYLAKSIRALLISLYNHKKNIAENQDHLIRGFANMVEAKDELTGEHIKRTSEYVKLICLKMMEKQIYGEYVTPHKTEVMVRAAPFHDLGKIGIPDRILNKTGKLTVDEFEIIKEHPTEGADFIFKKLGSLDDKELVETAREMALCHHEHLDGTGYPNGLYGDEIPISARIMAVADVLDALLSKRSYKEAYDIDKSFGILKQLSGSHLDPFIVGVIFNSRREVETILETGELDEI